MAQRIHNLSKWVYLPEGSSYSFDIERPRTVILDVNCPGEVSFYVAQDFGTTEQDRIDLEGGRLSTLPSQDDNYRRSDLTFIALVKGRDRLEFGVDGAFTLAVEGGGAYIFTTDGQDIATRVEAPEIFTRIANRRQRNPHLEMLEYRTRLNQERFAAQLRDESERRIKLLEDKLASFKPQRDQVAPDHLLGKPEGRPSDVQGDEPAPPSSVGPEPDDVGSSPGAKRGRHANKESADAS